MHDNHKSVCEIRELLEKANDIYLSLPYNLRQALLDFHNPEGSLTHCLRWGTQAAEDICSDWAKIVSSLENET